MKLKITALLMMLITAVVSIKDTEYWPSEDKPLLDILLKQVMSQQLDTEERTRSDGGSGIKQVSNVWSQI